MKKFLAFIVLFSSSYLAMSQYETPGTGVVWGFADLVEHSGGVVTMVDNDFVVHQDLTVASGDSLTVFTDICVRLEEGVNMVVKEGGSFIIDAPKGALFTARVANTKYGIVDITDGATAHWNRATFEHGIAIKVVGSGFRLLHSTIQEMQSASGINGAISGLNGSLYIDGCRFLNNQRAAINTGANTRTTVTVLNSYFYNNVLDNQSRPQLNIYQARANDTSRIVGNFVLGGGKERAGGISYNASLGDSTCLIVEDNVVKDNRFGLYITGTCISGLVRNNRIYDNNTDADSEYDWSGIKITASGDRTRIMLAGNDISGNPRGLSIATDLRGGPICNLGNLTPGDDYNIGENRFYNNGHNGLMRDLCNNIGFDVVAQNNLWGVEFQTEELIETVIHHHADDEKLGTVSFMPPYTRGYHPVSNLKTTVVETDDEHADVRLSWKRPAPIFENVRYNVYREEGLVATVDTVFFVDPKVSAGLYNYCIRVVYDDGQESVAVCDEAYIPGACNAPLGLTAGFPVPNDCTILLQWQSDAVRPMFNVYKEVELIAEGIVSMSHSVAIEPGKAYDWYIETVCGNAVSPKAHIRNEVCSIVSLPGLSEESVKVYPNPAVGVVRIEGTEIARIEVYNAMGQLQEVRTSATDVIDVSSYGRGVYLFKIYNTRHEMVTKRVMVSK